GRPMLRGCLASIAAGTVRPAAVVIVDQSCAAEIEHIARESCTDDMVVTYVPSSKRGRSAGLNEGIALVRTAYVAITDDDCEVAPDWVAHLLARLLERSDAIVTGRVEAGAGAPVLSVVT